MFEAFGANPTKTKSLNTSNPKQYPGSGYIFYGIDPDKALGLASKKDKQKVENYKKLFIERLNTIYADGIPHKYDSALENAKDSKFYFTRGFIAITAPKDKYGFTIPINPYPEALKRNQDYSPNSEFTRKR